MDLKEIYKKTVGEALKKDMRAIDCLLHPEKHPPVWKFETCAEPCGACEDACEFDALERDEKGDVRIRVDSCAGCGTCIDVCASKKLTASKKLFAVLSEIAAGKNVYALVAPAFFAQGKASIGQMRTCFKKMGFAGMLEIALFADILTLKESMDFLEIPKDDFMLASCCCPIWIAMIRKTFQGFVSHIPPSVSPMVAGGRTLKKLYENCTTVFVSPCLAKKSEAREPDVAGAIDYVLTFDEIEYVLNLLGLDPANQPEDDKDNTSGMGRLYARSGGVSRAVTTTVRAIDPSRRIRDLCAEGVPACRDLLTKLKEGKIKADYIEGMGCVGGCVGGPKTSADTGQARARTDELADEAVYPTPKENPFVFKLLDELGLDTLEKLQASEIFSRKF